jgi:hypothetical protein
MTEETKIQTDPYVNITQSHRGDEFGIALSNFDTQEGMKGYSEEDVQELIGLLERGVYHLNNCIEDYKRENDGKELKKENSRRTPRGIKRTS